MILAWGITGAAHLLLETFKVMKELASRAKVTSLLSSAAVEVVRMYGLWSSLKEISPGGYLREVVREEEQGSSSPITGRFSKRVYDALVVSPVSANTVAKVVVGIADTLITNAVAQAQKAGVPVYIVPTDQRVGAVETTLPYTIDLEKCEGCDECSIVQACERSAVEVLEDRVRINYLRCDGCGACVRACPRGAVKFGEKIKIFTRKIDLQNVEKLRMMEGVTVLQNPGQIPAFLEGAF